MVLGSFTGKGFKEAQINDKFLNYALCTVEKLSWFTNIVNDSTHGSLALKAYQQNLYLKYYY